MVLEMPVRFTGQYEDLHEFTTLELEFDKTAFLLVDCFDDDPESGVGQVLHNIIRPTLAAVRSIGMKPIFVYGGDHHDLQCSNAG
jgi:hypothetical protein